ncbi:MAG: hypothetical protein AAF436_07435 [Myxococcota bacterium]
MINTLRTWLLGVAFASLLALAPTQASAANCNFSKAEKISMVSWIIPIAGAVITPMACKRDLFNKKGKSSAVRPPASRSRAQGDYIDRRKRLAI